MSLMKTAKLAKRKSLVKRKSASKNVEEYLASVPETARDNFDAIRAAIHSAVPPVASEVISYGIPAIKYNGVLVWFAAFSKHCSVFPTAAVISRFKNELKDFSTSKGTIQFPNAKPVPAGLIKKIVTKRVVQISNRKRH